jgi:hypothetical protein
MLDEIRTEAHVTPAAPSSRRERRRERLLRLATVLECHQSPVRLMSQVEYMPRAERMLARTDNSPLTVAYNDPVLRGQGLASDRFGDATGFFDLSASQAHHLFCDCHYGPGATSRAVAERARWMANRLSLRDVWDKVRGALRG